MDDDKHTPNLVDQVDPIEGPPPGANALVEAPELAVPRLESQLAEVQDRYLRLAAEYDNFRKRTARERAESWQKAQVELLSRLVDGIDDLARFSDVAPEHIDSKALHEGIVLVERKLWKELQAAGLRRIDQKDVPFNPQVHEAVATTPAAAPNQDHTVAAVLQTGYMFGDILVRPARVQVRTWQGSPEGERA
ncbi:MAG TPA: nucleotide exchange factor GrpE [Gemmatimonadales bacterium]|nr:nucleotide exchange factor GrpE [Gemmatimonadales bacterium]